MEQKEINISSLGMKAQTKNKLYRILTVEAKLYLPPQKETSIYFIRGVVNGRKKVCNINSLKHCVGILCWWSKSLICASYRQIKS